MPENERNLLLRLFETAVESAKPGPAVLRHLPGKPRGRCVVVGAGKASAAMAAAIDAAWPDVALSGVVVTRYGHAVPAGRIRVLEAAHPVPDAMSEIAAKALLGAVRGLGEEDLVIAVMSGGGSSLLVAPADGMTLVDKQTFNRLLLTSGATIDEMNAVRKHLSAIKGGRLALAARPARVVTLVLSDVPGDDPEAVASGPTLGDSSTLEMVREIVARHALTLPPAARAVLASGIETPKPEEVRGEVHIIAAPSLALAAAADVARGAGLTPLVLGDALEGEAREAGRLMAGIAVSAARNSLPVGRPAVLLSGGETTVSIGDGPAGRGGRNTEFSLALALALKGERQVWSIAADTDGIDGTEDAAGAIVTPDTLVRARSRGLDAVSHLLGHDSYAFFEELGDLLKTGPTLTNVNDFRAILIR
jgi:glycerate 2-kinase